MQNKRKINCIKQHKKLLATRRKISNFAQNFKRVA